MTKHSWSSHDSASRDIPQFIPNKQGYLERTSRSDYTHFVPRPLPPHTRQPQRARPSATTAPVRLGDLSRLRYIRKELRQRGSAQWYSKKPQVRDRIGLKSTILAKNDMWSQVL
jgi:hypothetical protein